MEGLRSRKVLEEFFYANIAEKRARQTPDLFSALCPPRARTATDSPTRDVVNP